MSEKKPRADSNAARGKSPIRLLQKLIASGTLSPAEELQAVKKLAALKAAKSRERKAKAAEKQAKHEEQPREWRAMNRGCLALYEHHVKTRLFTGSLSEWLKILGRPYEGKSYDVLLREAEAERQAAARQKQGK